MAIGGWRESENPQLPSYRALLSRPNMDMGNFCGLKIEMLHVEMVDQRFSVSCDSSAVTVQSLFATILRWKCGWTFITEVEVDRWSQ